jgi:hypothetical protein
MASRHQQKPYNSSMKLLSKTAALLGLLALAGTASAQTVIHIAGATTYRAPVHQAIFKVLDPGFTFNCTGTNPYSAGALTAIGTLNVAGHPAVVIQTYWTGSVAGVYDVCNATAIANQFVSQTSANAANGATSTGFAANGQVTFTGTLNSGITKDATGTVESAWSDAFQSSAASAVKTAALGGAAAFNKINSKTLTQAGAAGEAFEGLIAFQWILGTTTLATGQPITAAQSNLTYQQAKALVTTGQITVGELTGVPADNTKYIVQIGRNEDSGSRVCTHAEAGNSIGLGTSQQLPVFSPANVSTDASGRDAGGSTATITGFNRWPANSALNTVPGINWNTAGHSGYTGGGNVRTALQSQNPAVVGGGAGQVADTGGQLAGATQVFFCGYLGTGDSTTGGNSIALNYNGVPFSVGAVQDGTYSLWGYEHFFYINDGVSTNSLSAAQKQIADAIADDVFSNEADVNAGNGSAGSIHGNVAGALQAGIFFDTNVKVQRSIEGGTITRNAN